MEGHVWGIICVCICLHATPLLAEVSSNEYERRADEDSGNVIMKEDAEEIFYDVDLQKYDGVRCPELIPPEHGAAVDGGTKVGSVTYIQCEQGFRLEGPTVIACVPVEGGAQWDPIVNRICVAEETQFDETEPVPPLSKVPSAVVGETYHSDFRRHGSPPFLDHRTHGGWIQHSDEQIHLKSASSEIETEFSGKESHLSCLEPPLPGPCNAFSPRYYFDKSTKECRTFIYGGCKGNDNNFATHKDCDEKCFGPEQ